MIMYAIFLIVLCYYIVVKKSCLERTLPYSFEAAYIENVICVKLSSSLSQSPALAGVFDKKRLCKDYLRPPPLLPPPELLLAPPPPDERAGEDMLRDGLLIVEERVVVLRVGVDDLVVVLLLGAVYVPLLLLRDGVVLMPELLLVDVVRLLFTAPLRCTPVVLL